MPNVHHITVTMRGPRDIAIDVPGACQVRCLGPDAFSRAARLFCEVEGGEDWPETAGLTGAAAMPISGPGTSRVMPEAMRGVKRPTGVMDSRGRDSRRDGEQAVHSEGPNGWNRRAL